MRIPLALGRVIGLALAVTGPAAQAQIYKWVDEQGRTHYSANKEDAARPKASEVKVREQPRSSTEDRSYWDYLRSTGKVEATPAPASAPSRTESAARAPMLSDNGHDDGTDKAKCNIAQDVLSGALRLRNGESTGEYERKTAVDDIRRHCR